MKTITNTPVASVQLFAAWLKLAACTSLFVLHEEDQLARLGTSLHTVSS